MTSCFCRYERCGWPALVRDRGRDEPPWLTILTVVKEPADV